MGRFVSLTKAAKLAGISVRDIQNEIATGKLASVRGMVHIEDLIERFPAIDPDDADTISKVTRIKEDSYVIALAKRRPEVSVDSLRDDIQKLEVRVAYYKQRAKEFELMVDQLKHNLIEIKPKVTEAGRIESIINWINRRLLEIKKSR